LVATSARGVDNTSTFFATHHFINDTVGVSKAPDSARAALGYLLNPYTVMLAAVLDAVASGLGASVF